MSDKKVIDDKICCETIAKSISDIIRFSLNDEFRKSCCELFGVFSTAQTEKEITKRLMSLIENTCTDSKIKRKKLSKEKDKENIEERENVSDEETIDQSTESFECESQMLSENSSQKSWLQISSQQYRTMVKEKKLQFYSQPLYFQHNNGEFSYCNSRLSNSQPISSTSSSSQSKKMRDTLKTSDNGVSFCKKKFKESFEENARKYFKHNLKYKGSSF